MISLHQGTVSYVYRVIAGYAYNDILIRLYTIYSPAVKHIWLAVSSASIEWATDDLSSTVTYSDEFIEQ